MRLLHAASWRLWGLPTRIELQAKKGQMSHPQIVPFRLLDRPLDPAPDRLYPAKPPLPKQAKAVTIAAAFPCKDGFVFCADQLMTHGEHSQPGSFAHYEQKVFGRQGDYYSALLCAAGPTDYLKTLKHSFFKCLEENEVEGEGLSLTAVEGALETCLIELQGKVNTELGLQTLVAVMDDHRRSRYLRSDDRVVRPVTGPEILGIGEASLVRFLIESAYHPRFTLQQGIALAALVVYFAKKYCAQYCGGDTDIYTLSKGEFITNWEPVSRSKIESLELMFKKETGKHLLQFIDRAASLIL